jgi:hypothetical protein
VIGRAPVPTASASVRTMCAACVAQGAVYVGGAVAGLQVMAARARHRRRDATVPPGSSDLPALPRDSITVGPDGPGDHDDAAPAHPAR